ncbi:WD repeat-containing protein 46 [Anoplophora glabripennis]|uniref:WD repeat-containing protein 46 n=1 Tax=Anoplophora glabripennis TaxID=217634 RepID=UPI000873A6AD|nr:WD repeat-containing protein 46 [Anoplophora glabripennis]
MGKPTQRYFSQPSETESDNTKNKQSSETKCEKVISYKIDNVKKQPWGRRQADRRSNKFKKIVKHKPNPTPKFKGKVKPSKELLKKYDKGKGVNLKSVKTNVHQKKIERKEKNIKFAIEKAASTEVLLTEDVGFLEADSGETTTQFTQKQIVKCVDIASAAKHFDLNLDFGPYRSKYTRNGRHLLLGGKRGHVAAFDWVTKKLHCEINVMESVHDISWLHIETMFAVAQKDWVYMYDNQGIELHCVKKLNKVSRMEFLPYHFLLGTCSEEGYLSWLDVSIGQLVGQYNTNLGRLSILTQNPWNATLALGHAKGVVSFWAPKSRDPLAKMLCHKAPITALQVDPTGTYMATSASNRELKIWDVRKLEGPVQEYKLITAANNLSFSQKKMLAIGMGNVVEVYRDCCATAAKRAYLRHRFVTPISNFNFCPYEDVLGVSTARGFTSLLIPGAGEPNFDSLEANPFQSKSQRREAEVKSLLEKIQPELITLDPTAIAEIDLPTLRDKVEAKKKLLHLKPPKINYEPRKKAKGKGGSVKMAKNKKILQEQVRKEFVRQKKELLPREEEKDKRPTHVLDRFLPKKS